MINSKKFKENLFITIIVFFSISIIYWQNGRILPLIDYSYQIENAYRILVGQIPYKDFFLVLPPGTYLYMALIMKIFGFSNIFQTIFLMISSIIIVFTTYFILKCISKKQPINKFLLLPLIVSGYSIYPFASYDISATLFMLLGWTMIWYIYKKNNNLTIYLLTGLIISIPSFFKQNTGLIYSLFSFILIFYEAYSSKENKWKKILFLTTGIAVPYLIFSIYLSLNHSFQDFIFQIFVFPSRIRSPIISFKKILIDFFEKINFIHYISFFLIYIICMSKKIINKNKEILIILILLISTILFPILYSFWISIYKNSKEFLYIFSYVSKYYLSIWYLIISILTFYILKNFFSKNINIRNKIFYIIFSIEIIIICLSSFLSQGIDGSTYGIYPLFIIMLSLILKELKLNFKNINWNRYILYFSILITINLSVSVIYNIRLSYFSKSGTIIKASIPEMKGLSTPGPWIKEMENMIDYVKYNIPSNETIISVPGEDPFYFLLKRKPVISFFQYLYSTFPYSDKDYANIIIDKKIQWIVVKNNTQFKYWINSESLLSYLKPYCNLYVNIPSYSIYKCINK